MKITVLGAAVALLGCGTGATTSGAGGSGSTSGGEPDGGSVHTIELTGCPLDSYYAPVTIGN